MRLTASVLLAQMISGNAVFPSDPFRRSLEQDEKNVYGSDMRFGKCLYVKIPEDQNDDAAEGNSYFYNGKYYAQNQAYASFSYCQEDGEAVSDGATCPASCMTPEQYYVTDLQTFLEPRIEYLQNLCQACQNQCRRRRLEDAEEEEEEEEQVDCDTCQTTCQYINNNNGGVDETQYLDCQQAVVDDDGSQYYSAPGCNSEGRIVIALYHNEECTVKSTRDYEEVDFEYSYFSSIQDLCVDCEQAEDVCQIDDDATICDGDGKTLQGDDDNMKICNKFYQVSKEHVYGKRRKKLKWQGGVALILLFSICFCTASYTYFIRHKKAGSKAPLSSADGQTSTPTSPVTQTTTGTMA